jgi:glycolate oxidase iron-sulfur subunit
MRRLRLAVKDYGTMFRSEPEPGAATPQGYRAGVRHQRVPASHRLCADPRGTWTDGGVSFRMQPAARTAGHHPAEGAVAACRLHRGRTGGGAHLLRLGRHLQYASAGDRRPAARRKLGNLRATAPDAIAAGNIGCITQLAGGGVPVVHTVQLLDWMAGGPMPAALEGKGA